MVYEMRNLVMLVCASLALTACAVVVPKATDKVRDAATAIQIARKQTDDVDGDWRATFSQGLWYVELRTSTGEIAVSCEVWADTGDTRHCAPYVVVT